MKAWSHSDARTQRFLNFVAVEVGEGCWNWRGYRMPKGYGVYTFRTGGVPRPQLAHRVMYELMVGPIPDGLQIDHLCRNRGCVNPDHLEPVTPAENNARSDSVTAHNGRKTHCAKHPSIELKRLNTGGPARRCVVCLRATKAKWSQQRSLRRKQERLHASV